MRRAWVLAWLAGCGAPEARLSDPLHFETVDELPSSSNSDDSEKFRGPGKWLPNLEAQAKPVDVSLITSGLMRGDTPRANNAGDHVTFALGGNACEVDATTGNMDTDTTVEGTVPEINDSEPTGEFLVVTSTGIYEVTPGTLLGGGNVDNVVKGEFSSARYVGGEVFGVTWSCDVHLPDRSVLSLGLDDCDEKAATDDGLVFASPEGTLLAHMGGTLLLDPRPVEHVAAVGSSVYTFDGSRVRALSEGWQRDLSDLVVWDLLAADDLGLVIVGFKVGDERQALFLDSETGESLGTFVFGDDTAGMDVSATNGLMLQMRLEDAVSWRISR